MTEYELLALKKLEESIQSGKWSNDGLVQLIELIGQYLNIKSIPEYAKENRLSYNGVKKCRTIIKLFNNKYVIDNE
jgi:hypothetical protein